MRQYQRKYLLRLNSRAIAHNEFAAIGSQSAAIVEMLGKKGLAECVDLDGRATTPDDPDAHWQITEAGLAAIGKAK